MTVERHHIATTIGVLHDQVNLAITQDDRTNDYIDTMFRILELVNKIRRELV